METQEQLIQALEAGHQAMRTLVELIGNEKELYPGWTMKHFLAHLTGWDEATTVSLRAHAKGNEPGTPADRGIDYYNAQSVAERESLDYRHIVLEWQHARKEFQDAIRELSLEKFNQEVLFPWGRTGSVTELIYTMIHHDRVHKEELGKLIPTASTTDSNETNQP